MAFFFGLWTPLAVSQQAYVMAQCPLCVCPSVCVLTFILNIFLAYLSTTCSGWAIVIDDCLASGHPSVRPSVNNYLKNLLWNQPTDFNETSQKWSLGDALSENFKDMNSVKNPGCHGNQKKKL